MLPSRSSLFVGLIALGLVVVSLVLYWPSTRYDFVYFDDPRYVLENPHVQQGLSRSTAAWAFTTDRMGTWHPLTWLSHAADWTLFGENPGGHHFTSILLHAFNAALLFVVLLRLTGSLWPSVVVALIFAVHPLNVASVAWVASRKGVLSTTFMLLALWTYARYAERPDLARYAAVIVAFALGLLSKPMLMSLPAVLLLLDVWPLRRMGWDGRATGDARPWLEKVPLALMAAAVALWVYSVRHTGEVVGWADRLAHAPLAYLTYLRRAFWPSDLATPYPQLSAPSVWMALLAAVALIALTALVLRARRERPQVAVGWLWYIVTLAPVIGVVQVGDQPMADRWMYVPMIGLWIAVVWGVGSVIPRTAAARFWVSVMTAIVVVSLGVRARAQLRTWRDTETLFAHAIEVTEPNRIAHYNLGWYLAKTGRPDEAVLQYRRAIEVAPDFFPARYNLAVLLWDEERTDEAVETTCDALRLYDPRARGYEARLRDRLGDHSCP